MQFMDFLSAQTDKLSGFFRHPEWLWLIPFLVIGLFFLIRKNFVTYGFDDNGRRRLRRVRMSVFILRSLAVIAIIIALATPFTILSQESDGNPRALVLIDRSGSMGLYDMSFIDFLVGELKDRLPTTVREFGSEENSPIGDATLGHEEHILLITDGNANSGVALMDVAMVIRSQNRTLNAINLDPLEQDAAVFIDAPANVPLGFPAEILVEVTNTQESPVPLEILIDGRVVHTELTQGVVELSPLLATGYHKIEARISGKDSNEDNNAHYRVIQVLDKPKIFILSEKRGALEDAISEIFDTTIGSNLPGDLSDYYSIIINDMKAASIRDTGRIADFLRDEEGGRLGNGLVTIGGFNSYDRGGYQNTDLETILPVKVGKPKRSIGENNLVFVLQVSGTTGAVKYVKNDKGELVPVVDKTPTIDVIKAQAISAINSLNLKNNVGLVAFGISTEGQSFSNPTEALRASVVKIADIEPLYDHKKELEEKIPTIIGGGTTAPDVALRTAVEMLRGKSGDKTIILLTNGRFSAGLGAGSDVPAKVNTLAVVENAYKRYGINTQTIGVGSTDVDEFSKKVDEMFLRDVAIAGDSTYDRATNLASLIIKYGDPNEKGFGEDFILVPLSLTHFITKDVELDAVLNGYNEVSPKDGSRILVSTDMGLPAVTTWNYFNGRVAALTVFTGSGLGPLLQGENSDLVRNTILWTVGNPSRKQSVRVTIPSTIVGRESTATFVSQDPISGDCPDTPLQFESGQGDTYVFVFTPEKIGFATVCGIPYAINGPSEHWRVGESKGLRTAVEMTGGRVFEYDKIDDIIENIKTISTRVTLEKTEIRNPFIVIALILFLLEIFIRRLTKIQK
ncbi:VWA domain-containing protein [Candidatus Woesearchaeota archaeon]|nr:VWA domain-containing protein [Candidatus Woesearchaeota archaeon]